MLPSFDLVKTFLPEPFGPLEPGLVPVPGARWRAFLRVSALDQPPPSPRGFPASLTWWGWELTCFLLCLFLSVYSLLLHPFPSQGGVAS